jgi:uncharacterized protein (DUF736 family)
MIIGKFQQEDDGVYVGSIAGFAGSVAVRIAPTALKGVDYMVTSADLELGVGWKRTSAKDNEYASSSTVRSCPHRPTAPC